MVVVRMQSLLSTQGKRSDCDPTGSVPPSVDAPEAPAHNPKILEKKASPAAAAGSLFRSALRVPDDHVEPPDPHPAHLASRARNGGGPLPDPLGRGDAP